MAASKDESFRKPNGTISKLKVFEKAWSQVRALSESTATQRPSLCKRRGKSSAFIREYTTISSRKSKKPIRNLTDCCILKCLLLVNRLKSPLLHSRKLDLTKSPPSNHAPPAITHSRAPDNPQPPVDGELVSTILALCYFHPLPYKKAKAPTDVGIYRFIALTSIVVKLLERMIANRLSWRSEEN